MIDADQKTSGRDALPGLAIKNAKRDRLCGLRGNSLANDGDKEENRRIQDLALAISCLDVSLPRE